MRRSRSFRGFTLVELLLGMIILSVVGVSIVRMVMSQTRFLDHQEGWRVARSASRSGLNQLMSDLRMVVAGAGGVEAAVAGGQDFTVRVPYAFGVVCASSLASATLSLMPVDSAMFWAPGFSGVAVRGAAGSYTYSAATALSTPGTPGACVAVAPNITIVPAAGGSPAGQTVNVIAAFGATAPPVASIVFLYRRIRYEFKASVAVPGRLALWRTELATGVTQELVAPFDNTSRVRFYVLNNATAQDAVPTLSDIRGFELQLDGLSETTPRGSTGPLKSEVTTSVFFENRSD